ncbi:Uncharacterised protein [Klebsiella pneumoniae]|nr:Uncharacterised protein [Klebsiella pneumoniae]
MNLGPGSLKFNHRAILNSAKSKKLIRRYLAGEIEWSHKDLAILKKTIRYSLRLQQDERCIYCRRKIKQERRNSNEDIEHFLDKSKRHYKKWAFNSANLALSCHACNVVKNIKDMGDASVQSARWLTPGIGAFRWLHPYYDDYHANIDISKGWVYRVKPMAPNSIAASNLINDCELYSIQGIERNAEAFKNKLARMLDITATFIKKGQSERALKMILASKKFTDDDWFNF